MRSRVVLALVAAMLMVMPAVAEDISEVVLYELVTVSERVVSAIHDNGSNMHCVATEAGLVFFDASMSTRVARRFRSDMEERFDAPTRALVMTHAHVDHLLGMGAFSDVPVYAAAAGRPRWDQVLEMEWNDAAVARFAAVFPTLPDEIEDAELRLPTDWFEDILELGTDDAPLTIHRTGGHTVDSSSAVVGVDNVVIAGDLVQARRRPYFGEPDTDFDAWIGALEAWETTAPKAVCGGHGPVIDAAELGEIRRWFQEAAAAMTVLKAQGATPETIVAEDELPAGYWPEDGPVPRWWGFCVTRLFLAS